MWGGCFLFICIFCNNFLKKKETQQKYMSNRFFLKKQPLNCFVLPAALSSTCFSHTHIQPITVSLPSGHGYFLEICFGLLFKHHISQKICHSWLLGRSFWPQDWQFHLWNRTIQSCSASYHCQYMTRNFCLRNLRSFLPASEPGTVAYFF